MRVFHLHADRGRVLTVPTAWDLFSHNGRRYRVHNLRVEIWMPAQAAWAPCFTLTLGSMAEIGTSAAIN